MTEHTNKLRAVFLAALMIGSVFAAGIAFTGSVAAAHNDADVSFDGEDDLEGSLIYAGQTIAIDATNADDDQVQLRRVTGETSSTPVAQNALEDDDYVVFDTSELETGDYFLSASNFSQENSSFEIVEQEISASLDPTSVQNEGTDATTDLTVTSDLRNDYNVSVTIDGFDQEDYDEVFDDVRTDDDDEPYALIENPEDATELDFTGIAAGNYTLDISVMDTDASDSVDVNVSEAADNDAEFVTGSPEVDRGDITTINVSLTSAQTGTVTIGSEDAGYQANVTVNDGNDDGYVEFAVNTYTMGNHTGAASAGNAFYVPGDTEDSVTGVELTEGSSLDEPIAASSYRTSVRTGDDANETAQDIGRIYINEAQGVTSQSIWTAPSGTDMGDVLDEVSSDDSIAQGDYVVHELEVSGVFGVLQNASDASDRQALQDALNTSEVSLSVVQTDASTQPNRDAKTLDYEQALEDENADVVADAENGTLYIVTSLDEDIPPVSEDRDIVWGEDAFNASFTLTEETNLVDENSTASAEFVADERTTEFSQDEYEVEAADNQTISGQSTAATGTELTVRAESQETPGEGFILSDTDVVVEDGEFTAEIDFSEAAVNSTFELIVEGTDASASGTVVEDAGGNGTTTTTDDGTTTTTTTTTTTDDGTTTTTDDGTTTTTDDGTTTTVDTGGDGGDGGDDGGSDGGIPGFGIGIALVAILGAALLALREN